MRRIMKMTALSAASVLCMLCGCEQKKVVLDNEQFLNFTAPKEGEEIAVFHIKDYGDVKIRLFEEQCPKGVENFKELIRSGYYDELIFHRVVKNAVIQSGDPKGDSTGGEDFWKDGGFEQTINPGLRNLTGAVGYAVGSDKLNGSQFYIVTGEAVNEETFELLSEYGRLYSGKTEEMYYQYGGQPYFDGGYEVFGQVFDGLDICLEIQNVDVVREKPKKSVVIEKAEIVPYDGSGVHWLNAAGEEQKTETETE
ncbi:MAG: peptidylprolyl isomerase [Oscillospiraceae bacterium]|nr:peptidylprolyl isomerase [Oscillospiraceae bacterium]